MVVHNDGDFWLRRSRWVKLDPFLSLKGFSISNTVFYHFVVNSTRVCSLGGPKSFGKIEDLFVGGVGGGTLAWNPSSDNSCITKKIFFAHSDQNKNERWRILKNVIILGFAFMLHFTAYFGMTNLQSSINSSASLGYYSLAAVYVALILSNIFVPIIMIR